jgi:hypothetical protein
MVYFENWDVTFWKTLKVGLRKKRLLDEAKVFVGILKGG